MGNGEKINKIKKTLTNVTSISKKFAIPEQTPAIFESVPRYNFFIILL